MLSVCCVKPRSNVEILGRSTIERRQSMTTDDPETAAASLEADLARTLGKWVTALAEDALSVGETSQCFQPGAPLRAPLRAGLRHLLHIARLSQGIEALAMLEVALVLRVTALQASPAEELDSETILGLRADTPLIEELFPGEREILWQFCSALIANERLLPSEQAVVATPASTIGPTGALANGPQPLDEVGQTRVAHAFANAGDSAEEPALDEPAREHDGAPDAGQLAHAPDGTGPTGVPPSDVSPDNPPTALEENSGPDELMDRLRVWAASYRPPEFGNRPYDLTRARAFVQARVGAWANA